MVTSAARTGTGPPQDGRGKLSFSEQSAGGVAAVGQCDGAAAGDRADPDFLQTAQGGEGLFLFGYHTGFSGHE